MTISSPGRHVKGEDMEEALEKLAVLVGAEHVDDIVEKFKVTLAPATPTSLKDIFDQKKKRCAFVSNIRRPLLYPLLCCCNREEVVGSVS